MAIFVPGKRDRHNRPLKSGKKNLVVNLSLTAMVDMFTVLVIFLLQSYNSTGEVLYIPKEVQLPQATETKELKPAHVVTVSAKELLLNTDRLTDFTEIKEQRDWLIRPLYTKLIEAFRQDDVDYQKSLKTKLRSAVGRTDEKAKAISKEQRRKVTVQADKKIDFLTIKKIMYTVTEAGAREINFAVISRSSSELESELQL